MPWGYAAATIGGALISSNATKSAANASTAGSQAAIDENRRQFDLTYGDLAPYRDVGKAATYNLSNIFGLTPPGGYPSQRPQPQQVVQAPQGYGSALDQYYRENGIDPNSLGGETPAAPSEAQLAQMYPQFYANQQPGFNQNQSQPGQVYAGGSPNFNEVTGQPNNFRLNQQSPDQVPVAGQSVADQVLAASPGYQFRLSEGQRALGANQSKYRFSPRAYKELDRYSQGFASNEFGNFLESQFRLSGIGGNAVNAGANVGASTAGRIGDAYLTNAANQGNASLANASNINNSINSGIGNYIALQNYNKMPSYGNNGYPFTG